MIYIQVAINLILLALLYYPIFPWLVGEWSTNEYYSHGFLIPALCVYFLWHKREELKQVKIEPSYAGLFLAAAGVALYVVAKYAYQMSSQCYSIPIVIAGLIYAQAGGRMMRKTAFPVFYSLFMVPFPPVVLDSMTFHLRLFSAKLTFFVLKLFGAQVERYGNIINLSTTSLVVADPCSGLRSLITMMAASLAIGYLFLKSVKKRVILFVFSILLAIVMNMIRLLSLAVMANILKLDTISSKLDFNVGMVVTALGFVVLFAVSSILRKR